MAIAAFVLISLVAAAMPMKLQSLENGGSQWAWAKSVENQKETAATTTTTTTLQFYFHDIVSGNDPTVVRVAEATSTDKSPTLFGALNMADDPLTEGPDPNSKLVGRAQGLYGSAGKAVLSLIMALNFCFTDGAYNGSCVTVLGRNPALDPVRELPIASGSGLFRLGRGYAIARTHWFNFTTGDAIVGYNVTVVH
ncbi:dirigent protein 23-like [Malania oleifera]|uniref:dirigent protein 23-like n=1 Tax=Malania oleifera TaxID=397392 RepID=UPI0025AE7A4E|nr:dirigent protein 23-like [Malania oleifera]